MPTKLVDQNGLLYFYQGLKTKFNTKVDKVDGKGLSTNDYTTAEKTKLAGIADNANNYEHPSYTPHESGLYKVTTDATGHVSAVAAVVKADITALGIPGEAGPTYDNATTSAAGLMSSADKTSLDDLVTRSASFATTTDVSNAVANAQHLTKQIVQALPAAAEASETVIYMLAKSGGASGNVYDEYMLVNGAFEHIGDTSTSFDLITNAEIDTILAS